jgi:aspartate-semialdehyde dehydrogenase
MGLKIAIVGATGLVGQTFIKLLNEYDIKIDTLIPYASAANGRKITFKGEDIDVVKLTEEHILSHSVDYALFSAGALVSRQFAPLFKHGGAIVIDNSSAFRQEDDVPLVVPEINMMDIGSSLIISNPNCSTIQSVLPLYVFQKLGEIKRISYATYQAVSGSGQKGIDDFMRTQNQKKPENYRYPIFDNVIPQIDEFLSSGYTKEELKMIKETQKILHIEDIPIHATCVRVPVRHGHSVDVTVSLKNIINKKDIFDGMANQPGIKLVDDIDKYIYPMPINAKGTDFVYVGRIRQDLFDPFTWHFFCSADNILKGAALNAIQILLKLISI